MTFDQVIAWARDAEPGEKLIYHRGSQLTNVQKRHNYSDAVFAARHAYNLGFVDLTQRRIGSSDFEYIATRRTNVKPPDPAYSKDTAQPVHLFIVPDRFLRRAA